MCIAGRPALNPLVFKFSPIMTTVPLHSAEVGGFTSTVELTQADADAAAEALAQLHGQLPSAQQAVIEQLVLQAGQAIA
jgi:hypothetical protein